LGLLTENAFSQKKNDLNLVLDIVNAKNPPKTIPEFLKKLPKSLLSQYAIQFSGLGLQKASLDNPRVFLYDLKGGMVISFNNDPWHSQYNELEILSYNRKKEEFELSEISFKNKTLPKVSLNPSICLACHQSGYGQSSYVRPIFGSFNNWQGLFGGRPLETEESEKEINYIEKFNTNQRASYHSESNRYSYLEKSFPLNQLESQEMINRPNHQMMNLLMFYHSRSIQKKMEKNILYQSILPWMGLFYFDSHVNGITPFGDLKISDLEKNGCFEKNPYLKMKFISLIDLFKQHLKKNNIYFNVDEAGSLKLQSVFEGMGYPLQALQMSMGIEKNKSFLIDKEILSPFAVLPGFILNDFYQIYLRDISSFKLNSINSEDIFTKLGVHTTEAKYIQELNEINPLKKINFDATQSNQCSEFYEKMIPLMEKSLK
jgi:hypothetical protein